MTTTIIKIINSQIDELNEQTAKLMGFKKVHWFMGKLCVQIEGDVPNNNIPWSPATNANDAMQIVKKYYLTLTYHADSWMCFSEHCRNSKDADPFIAICKSLIEHAKLG